MPVLMKERTSEIGFKEWNLATFEDLDGTEWTYAFYELKANCIMFAPVKMNGHLSVSIKTVYDLFIEAIPNAGYSDESQFASFLHSCIHGGIPVPHKPLWKIFDDMVGNGLPDVYVSGLNCEPKTSIHMYEREDGTYSAIRS